MLSGMRAKLTGKKKNKRQGVSAESYKKTTKQKSLRPKNAVTEKTDAQKAAILKAVESNILFQNLGDADRKTVIEEMYIVEVKKGKKIIKQGDNGELFYVVERGNFDILVGKAIEPVAQRGTGTCFGELALMYNAPRAATVKASQDSVLWAVDRYTFRMVMTASSEEKFEKFVKFLKGVQLLQTLSPSETEKVADALEEIKFKKGDNVIEQGQQGDSLFIVQSGTVDVYKDGKKVTSYTAGGYFGERALLTNETRAATCKTATDCVCLRLDRNAFKMLLGPLEEIMQHKVSTESGVSVKASRQKSSPGSAQPQASHQRINVAFSDLKVIGTLGKGAFGHVQLVEHDNSIYALKAVKKAQVVATGQQGHIMSEKFAMERLDHPFLVKLFATFKDRDRLYFLLEAALGGELFTILRARTLFDEDTAKFFAGSVILAFEYMHDLNIIYRDLKPENLLLDDQGFLKITDFGFAKEIPNGRTWTLCGTPDYLAPEIVAGKGHGKGVDWWTIGVLIYEMLASYPPFYDEDPMKTYAKIMHGAISFPSHFSKDAVSIIKKLLRHKATKRLGVLKGGARMIKKTHWFKNFNFDDLLNRKMKPNIVPKIKDKYDLSNFDDYSGDPEEEIEPYVDDGSNWDKDF